MVSKKTLVVVAALAIGSIAALEAQKPAPNPIFSNKSVLTIVAPGTALDYKVGRRGAGQMLKSWFQIDLAERDGKIEPVALDWQVSSFPLMQEAKYKRAKQNKQLTEVEYETIPGKELIIFRAETGFVGDAIDKLVLVGRPSDAAPQAYLRSVFEKMAKAHFRGPLEALPMEQRLAFVRLAHLNGLSTGFEIVRYKDRLYVKITMKTDPSVYNDAKLTENQQIAKLLSDRLLVRMREFASPVAEVSEIYGVAIHTSWQHRNFVELYSTPVRENLLIYSPMEEIRKFARADITNQQLIDKSEVLVKDIRIHVNMTGGRP